jgi:hypothetical protein
MLSFETREPYWNYYLSIEDDLNKISRYIEFSNKNEKTYSIELTRLLFSASSEFEVVMKTLCEKIDNTSEYGNIKSIASKILVEYPEINNLEIRINRFGLMYKPLSNWSLGNSPIWWQNYNNVKHHRNTNFEDANLKNVINSIGALYIANVYLYQKIFSIECSGNVSMKDTTSNLLPENNLVSITNSDYYRKKIQLVE